MFLLEYGRNVNNKIASRKRPRVSGDPVAANNGLFYLYSDNLGSTSAMQAPDGTVRQTRYTPFGYYRNGSRYRNGSGSNPITDRGYTGQKENMALGLMYYNARYYLPSLGRFLSADTIVPNPANPQSFNRYAYVENRPINFNDPSGNCGSEFSDAECWQEYDDLFNQFLANDLFRDDIIDLIGTGENYVRKGKRIIELYDTYRNCGGDLDCSDNPPRAWDPYENPCGWQSWQDCYERNPLFDFIAINISGGPGIGPTFSLIRDKSGNVYATLGGQVGVPTGFAGSVTGGKLTGYMGNPIDNVDEALLEETLLGFSESISVGAAAGITPSTNRFKPPNKPSTLQVGVYTPQFSYTFFSYTGLIYDNGSDAPWFWQK